MATSFAFSGAILDDRMTGFSQVVNQLDEGSAAAVKDVLEVNKGSAEATVALDNEDHHGKEIRVMSSAKTTITLPATFQVGFKCRVTLGVANSGSAHSVIVQRGDSDSKIAGFINGTALGSVGINLKTATPCAQWGLDLTFEAVEDTTDGATDVKFYRVSGSAAATVTPGSS